MGTFSTKSEQTIAKSCFLLYLCRRKPALGNLKTSFHCARLHFLCRRKPALGNLKTSFHCARLHFLCIVNQRKCDKSLSGGIYYDQGRSQ